MSLANDTQINCPGTERPIRELSIGDEVMAADINVREGKVQLSWLAKTVMFSSGTSAGEISTMIFIRHDPVGKNTQIIVSTDQVFLLANGKLIRARDLAPGSHQLVSANGEAVNIQEVKMGNYSRGINDFGLGMGPVTDPNGHLILAGGVVAGDYCLQLGFGNEQGENEQEIS